MQVRDNYNFGKTVDKKSLCFSLRIHVEKSKRTKAVGDLHVILESQLLIQAFYVHCMFWTVEAGRHIAE